MYARTIPMRHGLADLFENTGRFMDRSSAEGYSCHLINFRIDGCVIHNALRGTQEKKTTGNKSWDLGSHLLDQSICSVQMVTYTPSIMRWHPVLMKRNTASKRCRDIDKQFRKYLL